MTGACLRFVALDVEPVRIGKNLGGRGVGASEVDDDQLPALSQRGPATSVSTAARRALQLNRGLQPKDLLDGARPPLGLVQEHRELVGMLKQQF